MNRFKKAGVKGLVLLLRTGLSDYSFEEILEAVPQGLDLLSDDEIAQLIEAISKYRKTFSQATLEKTSH